MKFLVVNADDFGRRQDINRGVIDAHIHGVVTSATLMTTGECFNEAVAVARQHSQLHVGLHLDLSAYFVVQHGVGKICGYTTPPPSLDEIMHAIREQIKKFKSTGLQLSHIDSHYHIHLREEIFPLVVAAAHDAGVTTIRWFPTPAPTVCAEQTTLMHNAGLRTTDFFVSGWDFDTLFAIPDGATVELMTHPAYTTKKNDAWRYDEWQTACAEQTKDFFRKDNFVLCHGRA